MSFNSFEYFIFLPIVFFIYYFARDRFRWLILLIASYYFYVALGIPYLLPVLFLVTVITYSCGIAIETNKSESGKNALFWSGVAANLLVLIYLKYLAAMTKNLNTLFHSLAWDMSLPVSQVLVSIGVSYYVFQAISYLTDVYLEIEKAETHFGNFALYLGFFPKLLQGPIERAGDLLPQLHARYGFDYHNVRSGMLLFAWGLFKKVVVANRLAFYVNAVYDDVHSHTGLSLIVATYFYAMQLYCDFSGYTDMALGTARLFNIKLTQNFNSPYLATSVADFWRRWHISFSRWILDYIFKPLQMRCRDWKSAGTAVALIITFLASGVWHAANWCFVVWGLLHGIYLAVSVFYKPVQKMIYKRIGLEKTRIKEIWQIVVTFHLVCFAWIFFRANTISDAFYVVTHLHFGSDGLSSYLLSNVGYTGILLVLATITLTLLVHLIRSNILTAQEFYQKHHWLRWAVYYSLIMSIILLHQDNERAFIYFQF